MVRSIDDELSTGPGIGRTAGARYDAVRLPRPGGRLRPVPRRRDRAPRVPVGCPGPSIVIKTANAAALTARARQIWVRGWPASLLDAGGREILRELERKQGTDRTRGPKKGMAYLVGAGPGRADLITLRGAELLRIADCIIVDKLANPALLELARKDAEIIHVPKRIGPGSFTQDQINRDPRRKGAGGQNRRPAQGRRPVHLRPMHGGGGPAERGRRRFRDRPGYHRRHRGRRVHGHHADRPAVQLAGGVHHRPRGRGQRGQRTSTGTCWRIFPARSCSTWASRRCRPLPDS